MGEEPTFGDELRSDRGVFEISDLESRAERWHQLGLLALGLAGLWLGHEVATWASEPAATNVRIWTTAVAVFGVVEVGRAVARFVNSVSAHQARVFRWKHLALCGVGLLAIAVVLVASLLLRGPLDDLLAHGTVTGSDIVDVAVVIAAGCCLIGAVTAFVAATAEFRSERAWQHSQGPPAPPGG